MTFARPEFLFLALILLPAAAIFLAWASRNRRQALARLGESELLRRLMANINWRSRRLRSALWLLALASLLFAMARPQWGSEVREVEQEGLQVMIALDVSQSMLAADVKPNRLARAKLEISDLMNRLDGDEIGIALFSGASFVQVPLTSDYNTALSYLDSASPTVISRPGTVIGDAIRTAMRGFDPGLSSQKVLIVMTDGEDRETDPLAAAQEAADAGVLIYTIGFGTPDGEPVPETNALGQVIGFKQDRSGNQVLSRLEEGTLQQIAEIGNGRYFRATPAGNELDALLNEIDSLQTAQLQSRLERTKIERFQPFLALALLLLVVAELIPDRVSERKRLALPQRFHRKRQPASPTFFS